MSKKSRLDRKIGFQNMFYTKCINVIIDSVGPSIILRSIFRNKICLLPQFDVYFFLHMIISILVIEIFNKLVLDQPQTENTSNTMNDIRDG